MSGTVILGYMYSLLVDLVERVTLLYPKPHASPLDIAAGSGIIDNTTVLPYFFYGICNILSGVFQSPYRTIRI